MRKVILVLLAIVLPGWSAPAPFKNLAEEEQKKIEGTWLVQSAIWGGEPFPLTGKEEESKVPTWGFVGGRFRSFIDWKYAYEAGKYRIDPTRSPKELDLYPSKGEVLTTRKCVYTLTRNTLKIAFTLWFAPGTPEQEIETAKKMRATRPESLDDRQDTVVVLTLKRQNK